MLYKVLWLQQPVTINNTCDLQAVSDALSGEPCAAACAPAEAGGGGSPDTLQAAAAAPATEADNPRAWHWSKAKVFETIEAGDYRPGELVELVGLMMLQAGATPPRWVQRGLLQASPCSVDAGWYAMAVALLARLARDVPGFAGAHPTDDAAAAAFWSMFSHRLIRLKLDKSQYSVYRANSSGHGYVRLMAGGKADGAYVHRLLCFLVNGPDGQEESFEVGDRSWSNLSVDMKLGSCSGFMQLFTEVVERVTFVYPRDCQQADDSIRYRDDILYLSISWCRRARSLPCTARLVIMEILLSRLKVLHCNKDIKFLHDYDRTEDIVGKQFDCMVRHKCHDRSCLNPSHLVWGTAKQNADDRETAKAIKKQHKM